MRRLLAICIITATLVAPWSSLRASQGFKTLGRDPVGDAPAGTDLTAISVKRVGNDLVVRFEVDGLPQQPDMLSSTTLSFDISTNRPWNECCRVVAEIAPEISYRLEGFATYDCADCNYESELDGSYQPGRGLVSVIVPLRHVGRAGTRIFGCYDAQVNCGWPEGHGNVLSRHASLIEEAVMGSAPVVDGFWTDRSFLIPAK